MINVDKGQFPSQQAVYLDITVDTQRMQFVLPESKVTKILESGCNCCGAVSAQVPGEAAGQGGGYAAGWGEGNGLGCEDLHQGPIPRN